MKHHHWRKVIQLYSIGIAGILLLFLSAGCSTQKKSEINLAGTWHFAIDSLDQGMNAHWYDTTLPDTIMLPGSMNSNGKGNPIGLHTHWTGQIVDSSFFKNPEYAKYRQPGNFKVPFWLQPLRHYEGAAWYQKEVTIPNDWKNKHISLFLERCHWQSQLWVDNREIGMRNSLGAPHTYDLTGLLKPGKHRLTLCIDNRIKDIDPGVNSHSISDHTQTNWNGIVGQMYLKARPELMIRSIQVFPDIANRKIRAHLTLLNGTGKTIHSKLRLQAGGATVPNALQQEVSIRAGESDTTIEYPMGDNVKLWDEFHPNVYRLTASLENPGNGVVDSLSTTFGMRNITVSGRKIEVNGRPVFLRGTLNCAAFPETGYPDTDVKSWMRVFRICRAHGLNHMRFHSWCPPDAAFEAADKSGFYLQIECSSWANQSTTLGDGKPIDKYIYQESKRIVNTFGNHPSFCMMAYGNEPGGKNVGPYLTKFVTYWKNRDPRRIYTSAAGWPLLPVNDYQCTPTPRIQAWGEGLNSIINAHPPQTDYDWSGFNSQYPQPVVSHEIGQWCVYPNFKEIPKYTGDLRAKNFEIFRETLKEHGMAQLADSFLLASGKLQALCYKADIEAALRTKDFGGFQMLGLSDFPGQGTALVGVLDVFWDQKGYITPKAFSQFCNSTVPLARMKRRILTNDQHLKARVEVAHYGPAPIEACLSKWKVLNKNGKIVAHGKFQPRNIPIGNGIPLGQIDLPLTPFKQPQKLRLEVSVKNFTNGWDFWVYPAKEPRINNVVSVQVVQTLNRENIKYLRNGGKLLLNLKKGALSPKMGGNVAIGFSSIFWNTAWTHGQAPHTLGILCHPNHPALAEFPTSYYSNWQWWDAMSHSGAIDISSYPVGLKPIVRVIDDWFSNKPLALLFEVKVGKGKLMVSGIDLTTNLSHRPEARQLLYSIKKYMAGDKFQPKTEMTIQQIEKLFKK